MGIFQLEERHMRQLKISKRTSNNVRILRSQLTGKKKKLTIQGEHEEHLTQV